MISGFLSFFFFVCIIIIIIIIIAMINCCGGFYGSSSLFSFPFVSFWVVVVVSVFFVGAGFHRRYWCGIVFSAVLGRIVCRVYCCKLFCAALQIV